MFTLEECANHIYDENGKRETINSLITGQNKPIWNQALSNEFGRLAQGNDAGIRHTDAIDFIKIQKFQKDVMSHMPHLFTITDH